MKSRRMKVLHLVSNHKLTGPVDPAIRLARSLLELGMDSRVAVGRPSGGKGPIDDLVRERGLEPITALRLNKHRGLFSNFADVRVLRRLLAEDPVDIVHVHLDNAHGIALRALSTAAKRPLLVRSLYDAAAPPASRRYIKLFAKAAPGVFVFGESVRRDLIRRFQLPESRVVKIDGAVRTDTYYPRPKGDDLLQRFALPRDAVVVGIVARIQRHRRFEILLEAFRRVMARLPNVYLLVLGRGTHARAIAHAGAQRLGITDRVRLPGYMGGADYPAALACFDVKVFLVPGSDGTCRAVREAMATGVPVIASRRGLLPEIVRDGVDGLVVEDEVEPLAEAIGRLAGDADLRRRLGQNALTRAREQFCQKKQAESIVACYERWLREVP